jgi:phosphohistidine phosphatase
MDIYFLRHASAGQTKAPTPQEDEKRPLDARGIEQSKQMGKLLAALGVRPDAFLSSPLTRAVQTAELAAEYLKGQTSITLDNALRPEASYEQFQDLLQHYARQKAIIVTGHNPSQSEFLSYLISGGTAKNAVELKKGAVAKVEYQQGKATLQWCVTPKLLSVGQESARTSSRPKTSRK